MAATSPQPNAAPAPPDDVPKKRRNTWIWVSAGVGLIAVGLLVWALTMRSDLSRTQDELTKAQQQVASTDQQLETTQQELGSTKQQLDTTAQQLEDATQAASSPPASEEDASKSGTAGLVAA